MEAWRQQGGRKSMGAAGGEFPVGLCWLLWKVINASGQQMLGGKLRSIPAA